MWMEENSQEIEELNNKYDYFNLYRKIKELSFHSGHKEYQKRDQI